MPDGHVIVASSLRPCPRQDILSRHIVGDEDQDEELPEFPGAYAFATTQPVAPMLPNRSPREPGDPPRWTAPSPSELGAGLEPVSLPMSQIAELGVGIRGLSGLLEVVQP